MENGHSEPREEFSSGIIVGVMAAMLLFTVVVTTVLLTGGINSSQGYLWLGVCCLFPLGWYGYGYFCAPRAAIQNGLLITIVGWMIIAISFWMHYRSLLSAAATTKEISHSGLIVMLLLGVSVLIIGGLISWRASFEV